MSTISSREKEINPYKFEERTSATPILADRQRGGLEGRQRSHYNPPGSSGAEGYGTILIKARSDGGDQSLPVSMLVTSTTTTNRQPDEDRKAANSVRDRDPPRRKSRNEVEYHSDKYF